MTLQDMMLPLEIAWARQHALLFSPQLAQRLAELHSLHGRPDCKAIPLPLIDGRLMLTADILTATEPGGYLHAMWQAADKTILLPAVEVVPLQDAVSLLVPQPVMG